MPSRWRTLIADRDPSRATPASGFQADFGARAAVIVNGSPWGTTIAEGRVSIAANV